jgi:acyl-CoA synthetase (AMP-forming)/AMP-acid ligase II
VAANFTLATIVREHAAATPNAPALTFEGATLSFAELDERSSRAANAMRSDGVRNGDRVALLTKNVREYYELMFAASKIGAILVCLNFRLAAPEISAIVADATPTVIIVGPGEQPLLAADARESPGVRRVVELGPEYEAWLAKASPTDPGFSGQPDDATLLLYTSGTTGVPKGVVLTNHGMSYTPRLGSEIWGMGKNSVNLVAMPMFHIGGIGNGLGTMSHGGHTVLMRDVDVKLIIENIETYGVTHSFFVPAVIQMILAAPGIENAKLSTLQLLCYGASPIGDAVLLQALDVFGCGFMQVYGMTEGSGTLVVLDPRDHDPGGPRSYLLRSCGRALPWVELRVVDPDTLSDVKTGSVGEIWVKSGMVMKGYWNKPDATAEAIVAGGWFRTGDAAYQDEGGYIYLFDRFKDMIISGGENVYSIEVENAIYQHPAVLEAAVFGIPDEQWGERVHAAIVLKPGTTATEDQIIAHCRQLIGGYKLPRSIEFHDQPLPKSGAGKLLKRQLRQPHWQGLKQHVH